MDESNGEGAGFEALWREHRPMLVDLAFRMLGNIGDAEDVVQDAFARLLRADLDTIEDVRGWLVVVVSRRCLDVVRSARVRRDGRTAGADAREPAEPPADAPDPADRVTLDDSVRMALLVVLEELTPAERATFVLHDVFRYPFGEVDVGAGDAPVPVQVGRDRVAANLMRFFNGAAGITLVSQSINGWPGVLAFEDGHLYALVTLEVRDGRISDIHAVRNRLTLAAVGDLVDARR